MGVLPENETHTIGTGDHGNYCHCSQPQQRSAVDTVKGAINEIINEKLDLESFSPTLKTFCIADLGCSVGPNTIYCLENIIDAVKNKYILQGHASNQILEFQLFFNDLEFNDFNTLFKSLPRERRYLTAGVPGSFHGRLFAKSSIHFLHSAYALMWLSKIPPELLDKNSPAWNKGKIHYGSAPVPVAEAFAGRFYKDMEMFLDARAEEVVEGGIMVLIIPSFPDDIPCSSMPMTILFDHLGNCLMDMAREGLISEALVDSFNVPVYIASPKEMAGLAERNGCFNVEKMVLTNMDCEACDESTGQALITLVRVGMEGIISSHFGAEIIDELFHRCIERVDELMPHMAASQQRITQLTVFLKRNATIKS